MTPSGRDWLTAFVQGFLFAALVLGNRAYPDALHGFFILAGAGLSIWLLTRRRNHAPTL